MIIFSRKRKYRIECYVNSTYLRQCISSYAMLKQFIPVKQCIHKYVFSCLIQYKYIQYDIS